MKPISHGVSHTYKVAGFRSDGRGVELCFAARPAGPRLGSVAACHPTQTFSIIHRWNLPAAIDLQQDALSQRVWLNPEKPPGCAEVAQLNESE